MRTSLFVGLLFLLPSLAYAAPYAEFAPDYSEPLLVQPNTTVTQVFAPLNDRLSVIELWVSTGGATASLDITLQDQAGTTVATRTTVLGAIADGTGGTRTRIVLPSQISVSGGQPYRLNITPTGSAVNIYHSASVSLVPGSGAGGATSYRYGSAIVDGLVQGYSFKFALTEAAETTLPVMSNLQIVQPAIGQAMFNFNSSEPVDIQIAYGSRTVGWTGEYATCLNGVLLCSVLMNVNPGTTYSYTATLKDTWGNTSTTQGTFTAIGVGPSDAPNSPTSSPTITLPPPSPSTTVPVVTSTPPINDLTAPVISNPRLLGLSPNSATFAWTTNEAANSSIVILGEGGLVVDSTYELEHYMTIGGLITDHYYRMRISSSDYWGNYSDVLLIFTTPETTIPSVSTAVSPSPGGSVIPGTPTPTPSYTVVYPSSSLPPPGSSTPIPTTTPTGAPTSSPTTSVVVSSSPSPTAVAYPSTSTEPGEVHWPPAGGNVNGYRIDIFDEFGNLITTITVDANATSAPLPGGLPAGARIIIYADRGGAFEKVTDPISITDRPYVPDSSPLLTPVLMLVGGGTLLVALIVAFVWQRRRQRVKVDAMTSIGIGGGQSSASSITRGLDR